MRLMPGFTLLSPSDPDPVRSVCKYSQESPFLLIGDHAGTAIPAALGDLGLSAGNRGRHIAVDLGMERMGTLLSEHLQAPFVWQTYSRLVADCNRDPNAPDWAAQVSDGIQVPGNQGLEPADLAARRDEVFEPYHAAIADLLNWRGEQGIETILISLHSFTPIMQGKQRPWGICVLHDGRRDEFARDVLTNLQRTDRVVGDNEPYDMDDTD